jgi:hypothetical protein
MAQDDRLCEYVTRNQLTAPSGSIPLRADARPEF